MTRTAAALIIAVLSANAANPVTGHAADNTVEVNALFLDAAAVQQATGSDFKSSYTVIEVTVLPKGDKPLAIDPEDFLLRIGSDSESSGPMAASQVYGAGSAFVLHSGQETIGITRTDPGYSGVSIARGSPTASADTIKSLQEKMLPAKTTSEAVKGLLFFPIAKKKPRDLDLVYTSPAGNKLHIAFH
jgi:hypothetical protein